MVEKSATAVEISDNEKTGPVSATYASQHSCSPSCPFYGEGCYAEMNFVGITFRRLTRSGVKRADDIARSEAKAIRGLSGRRDMRLHVSGDCRTNNAARIVSKAAMEHKAKKNRDVWTYSHSWRDVLRASWGTVSVLASVETAKGIRAARRRGYAAAIVVRKFISKSVYKLDGEKVLPCPAQTSDVQCVDCKLCWKDSFLKRKGLTIGFETHGGQNTIHRANRSLERITSK